MVSAMERRKRPGERKCISGGDPVGEGSATAGTDEAVCQIRSPCPRYPEVPQLLFSPGGAPWGFGAAVAWRHGVRVASTVHQDDANGASEQWCWALQYFARSVVKYKKQQVLSPMTDQSAPTPTMRWLSRHAQFSILAGGDAILHRSALERAFEVMRIAQGHQAGLRCRC